MREMDLIIGRFADAHIADAERRRPRRIRAADGCARAGPVRLGHRAEATPPRTTTRPLFRRLRAFHLGGAEPDGEVARRTARARPRADARRRRGRRRRAGRRRPGARGRRARERAGDQPGRDLPRRAAHGAACPRACVLRARDRDHRISGLGLPALRPRVAACRRGGAAHDHAVAARAPARDASGRRRAHHRQRRAPARAGAQRSSRRNRSRPRPATCWRWTASIQWLELNGYNRASTVREPGDYAVRGGIVDLYPPGMGEPVRLDFFGDTLESIRSFDAETQRTDGHAARARSRAGRRNSSSPPRPSAASAPAMSRPSARPSERSALRGDQRRPPPSRHGALAAAVPSTSSIRCSTICRARRSCSSRSPKMPRTSASRRSPTITKRASKRSKPTAPARSTSRCRPTRLYLDETEWKSAARQGRARAADAVRRSGRAPWSMPARGQGRNFAPERTEAEANVFDAVTKHVHALQGAGKRVVIALWSDGSRDRMSHVLADHGLGQPRQRGRLSRRRCGGRTSKSRWRCSVSNPASRRRTSRSSPSRTFWATAWCAAPRLKAAGELHRRGDEPRCRRPRGACRSRHRALRRPADHQAAGAPHDCLELHYAGNAKLYLPVENIELLSRYGSEDAGVELDQLGGLGWQTRKARMKNRIREMAAELIKIAAERLTRAGRRA